MPGVNRKYMIPRIAGVGRFTFSRGKFLDETIATHYGPGHRPNQFFGGYKPPTDWPAAGTLLRVPQVVWLQARFAKAQLVDPDPYENIWILLHPATEGEIVLVIVDGVPYAFDSGPFSQSQPNTFKSETARLISVFEAVKAHVEGIRPNRTWVEVIDWHDMDRTGGTVELDPDYGTNGFSVLDIFTEYSEGDPLPSFFGTNFLNIYCGDMMYGRSSYDSSFTDLAGNPIPVEEYIQWTRNYPTFKGLMPLYRGHSTRLYHPTAPFGPWAAESVALPLIARGPLLLWFSSNTTDFPAVAADVFDQAAVIAAGDGIDMTHPGATEMLTFESLLALIAEHYGFDPDTGQDVG